MKNILKLKNSTFIFLLFVFLFTGCKKDKYQNYSSLINKNPLLSDVLPSSVSSIEKDSAIDLHFTLRDAPIVDLIITLKAISGTATEGEDFDILTPTILIPAFSKEGVVSIQLYKDDIIEGDESFVLQVGDSTDANVKPYNITVTLSDYIGPNLDITFDWNKIVDVPDFGPVPTGPNFDIDIYVFNEEGNDIGNYSAATGASPEHLSFTTPDDTGTYYLYANLWANVFRENGLELTDLVPITMDFHRDGKLGSFTKTQPDSVSFNLNTLDTQSDGGDSFVFLCKVVVGTDMFMVYDTDDSELVTARRRNPIYSLISQKPKNPVKILKR